MSSPCLLLLRRGGKWHNLRNEPSIRLMCVWLHIVRSGAQRGVILSIIVPQVRTKMMCRSPLRSTPRYPRRFPTQKGTLSARVVCPSITRGFSSQIFFVFEKKLRLDIVTRGYDRGTACARSRVPPLLLLALIRSRMSLSSSTPQRPAGAETEGASCVQCCINTVASQRSHHLPALMLS